MFLEPMYGKWGTYGVSDTIRCVSICLARSIGVYFFFTLYVAIDALKALSSIINFEHLWTLPEALFLKNINKIK